MNEMHMVPLAYIINAIWAWTLYLCCVKLFLLLVCRATAIHTIQVAHNIRFGFFHGLVLAIRGILTYLSKDTQMFTKERCHQTLTAATSSHKRKCQCEIIHTIVVHVH